MNSNELFWLTEEQMELIKVYFPAPHGVPRVDDRRVLSGIIYVLKNGLQWKDAPRDYGPMKTIYNRFYRWSRMGVFDCIFKALAKNKKKSEVLMIDTTHLKVHRTAARLLKKGAIRVSSAAPKED
jgi:transposase